VHIAGNNWCGKRNGNVTLSKWTLFLKRWIFQSKERSCFEPCKEVDAGFFFTTTEILTWLRQKASVNLNEAAKQKMGKALKANGYLRIKRHNRWVYALRQPLIIHPKQPGPLTTKGLQVDLLG
jgi:hypothetical protein